MGTMKLTDADTRQAMKFWEEYQKQHDLSDRKGQAAGIDPKTGRVWFGQSMIDIARELDRQGLDVPLLFIRVGLPYYMRKGGRR
jgi:hypothetical protein